MIIPAVFPPTVMDISLHVSNPQRKTIRDKELSNSILPIRQQCTPIPKYKSQRKELITQTKRIKLPSATLPHQRTNPSTLESLHHSLMNRLFQTPLKLLENIRFPVQRCDGTDCRHLFARHICGTGICFPERIGQLSLHCETKVPGKDLHWHE